MSKSTPNKKLLSEQSETFIHLLKDRFEKNPQRHKGIKWTPIEEKLLANPAKLWSLHAMEASGGEPDVVEYDKKSGTYTFFDCAAESPKGRRSICFDRAALDARKEHKPANSAHDMAAAMGIDILTEAEYRALQQLGEFDLKTSSWLQTPAEVRKLDGALFGDRRYGMVFLYHNGVQSYYGGRGFRGKLVV